MLDYWVGEDLGSTFIFAQRRILFIKPWLVDDPGSRLLGFSLDHTMLTLSSIMPG